MFTASALVKRHQRTALLFLLAPNALSYLDRATISVAAPLIRQDLGLSLTQLGLVMSTFMIIYSFMFLPVGVIVDKLKSRVMIGAGLLVWSVAQALGGVCTSFGQLLPTRAALAVGEVPLFPAALRVLRVWYSARDRGIATGVFASGSTLGMAISAPLLTWLMLTLSWRWMFAIMSAVGILLSIAWFAYYRDPPSVILTAEERAYLGDGEGGKVADRKATFREATRLLRFSSTWGIALGFGASNYLYMIYISWLPVYLETDRHLSIANTGFVAAIPFVFGIFGSLFGGYIVDLLVRRGFSPVNSSRIPFIAGALVATLATVVAAEAATTVVAVIAMSVAVCSIYVLIASDWTLIAAVAPKDYIATLAGFKGFAGYIGSAFAPVVTGFLAHVTGSFSSGLYVGASMGIVSALSTWILVRRPISDNDLATAGARQRRITGENSSSPKIPAEL